MPTNHSGQLAPRLISLLELVRGIPEGGLVEREHPPERSAPLLALSASCFRTIALA